MKNAVKPLNQPSLTQVYTGNPVAVVRVNYLVIAPNGDGDNVQYKTYASAVESLYDDRGLCKIFDHEMVADDVNFSDPIDVSDWLVDNAEAIANKHGFRILGVLV